MNNETWSDPNHGVSHYGDHKKYWSTVCDYGSFVELRKWFPGCGFSPIEETFDTLESAKKAGELWARQRYGR